MSGASSAPVSIVLTRQAGQPTSQSAPISQLHPVAPNGAHCLGVIPRQAE